MVKQIAIEIEDIGESGVMSRDIFGEYMSISNMNTNINEE